MMTVVVIDYGTGNLHSLVKGLERGGAVVRVHAELDEDALTGDAVVLPAVGSFAAAGVQLQAGAAALHAAIAAGKPCLGISLGMQLLFDGAESGPPGLSALSGHVRRLHTRKLPHMGWNDVSMMDDPLFHGIDRLVAYYANSFAVAPTDESEVIAWTQSDSERFPAAVRRDNICGVQFRPEKSGAAGLQVLRNFVQQTRR